ncbi:MAG: glutamyl-tRNA reductase [Anaerocolumna sp.]|nr:glutamyl-tRNA reductase [Anaerocolumna sp.]
MSIHTLSISHKTAPVEIRELLTFTKEEKCDFLKSAVRLESITECVLITTCNRTEIYMNGNQNALEQMIQYIVSIKNLNYENMLKYFNRYSDEKSIHHLFRVTSGIDSMLVGEDEILGQVKENYQLAFELGTTGFLLNTLFREAITCAKKVKTNTKISKTPISIGTLASHEIINFIQKDKKKKVLIIGLTGKMGTILMKNLYHNSHIDIVGTIRSHNISEEFISYPKVKMIDYQHRYEIINEVDIIVSATTSPHYTITYDEVKKFIYENKPRLLIDLSVPLDIDKNIEKLDNMKLIDIDYFKKLSENNNTQKLQEVESAKSIIDEEVDNCLKLINFREFLPYMENVKSVFEKQPLESILYQLRDLVPSNDFDIILSSLKKLVKD